MATDWDDKTPTEPPTSGPVTARRRYEVTFTYAEPEYARTRGIEEVAYIGVFEVVAGNADEAIVLAGKLFREAEVRSGVSWPREIRSTSCRLLST
jgi:hypothetical protein